MNRLVAALAIVAMLVLPAAALGQSSGKASARPQAAASPVQPAPADQAARMFRQWDGNGDGQLSLPEFRAGWEKAQAALSVQARLRRQFAAMDGNHDGWLDAGEYGNLVLVRNAGRLAPPLARFDANGDGKLDFPEYVRLVEALAPQRAPDDAGKAGPDGGKGARRK